MSDDWKTKFRPTTRHDHFVRSVEMGRHSLKVIANDGRKDVVYNTSIGGRVNGMFGESGFDLIPIKAPDSWSITVYVNGNNVLTIDENTIAGVADDLHDETIRLAARSLMDFIGESPVTWIEPEPDPVIERHIRVGTKLVLVGTLN